MEEKPFHRELLIKRLSNDFGHIAHYNQHQFYETWFTCDKDRLEFLKNTLAWPCWE